MPPESTSTAKRIDKGLILKALGEKARRMNVTLSKALVALLPACLLFSGSAVLFLRGKTLASLLQLLGAGFLVLADLLARSLLPPTEIPVGILTAFVGGPFFLWLLRRERREYRL